MAASTKQKRSLSVARSPLQRGFQILRFLAAQEGRGARAGEIAAHIAVHRVNAHRLIRSLMNQGFIEQSPDLFYHLGFEAWTLGLAASRHFVHSAITGAMVRISEQTQESVFAMRRAGDDGYCIAIHEGPLPIRFVNMRVGSRRALGIGGVSTAILSALQPGEAAEIIERNNNRLLDFGVTAETVKEQVRTARKNGYSFSEGVVVAEVRTLAVPVITADRTRLVSLGVLTTESRLKEPRRSQLANLLKREAVEVGRQLC